MSMEQVDTFITACVSGGSSMLLLAGEFVQVFSPGSYGHHLFPLLMFLELHPDTTAKALNLPIHPGRQGKHTGHKLVPHNSEMYLNGSFPPSPSPYHFLNLSFFSESPFPFLLETKPF